MKVKNNSETHPSEMSRDELKKQIEAQVEEEKQVTWREAVKKSKGKLDAARKELPPAFALHQGATPVPEKAQAYSRKQLLYYLGRNELGDSEMLLKECRGKFCFDKKAAEWWRFDGVWLPDAVDEAGNVVMDLANHYDKAAKQQAKDVKKLEKEHADSKQAKELHGVFKKRAAALRATSRRSSVLKTAAVGKNSLAMSGEEWDRYPTLLAVQNGYVDLETGKLYPPDPKLFIRQRSPYPYLGLHHHDEFFDDMVRKLFCNSEELMHYVQKVVGYSATGNLTHKEFYTAFGPLGNNGKSMFFNAINDVLGDYSATLRTDLLLEGRGLNNEDPFWIALRNKRMAIASEAKKGSKFSMDRIKLVTGADSTVVRGLYADPTEIRMPCKLFLHTNDIPSAHGGDKAFMDRLRVIPFMARFTNDTRQVDESRHIYLGLPMNKIEKLLKRGGPAILSYIILGAKMYQNSMNLVPPPEVELQTKEYIEESDVIGEFIKKRCDMGEKYKAQATPLYHSFKAFCTSEKSIPEKGIPGLKAFGEDLKRREGITKDTSSNYTYYRGLRVKPDFLPHKKS